MKKLIVLFIGFAILGCNTKKNPKISNKSIPYTEEQEAIIDKYIYNCADTYNYNSPEYQACLDDGLKKDSTIAYLWQQKAMPYFKQMKYEVGMEYIDRAVKYKPERYLPYRAFIKCIFAKTYVDAIKDFKICIKRYGNNYEMDHSYKFYVALSYLQLNKFIKAERILKKDIQRQIKEWGEAHHLDLFYYGISKYEQQKYKEAIMEFDKALELYPTFSDVIYYKSLCLVRLGKLEEARKLYEKAKREGKAGNTVNEANSVYETYPYQIRWH